MNRFLKWNLLVTILGLSSPVLARVATAPNFLDQRLINPAASSMRSVFGSAFEVRRQTDKENVLNLTDSSIEINTTIDTFEANNAWRTGAYTWELNLVPQKGTKSTNSTSLSDGNKSNASTLSLIPIQASVGTKVTSQLSVGLKTLYTYFNFDDSTDLTLVNDTTTDTIKDGKSFKGQFLVVAPGLVYELPGSGLSIGYVAEFMQFTNDQKVEGKDTRSGIDSSFTTNTNVQSNDTVAVRKDILGVGCKFKFSGNNIFRMDISYEKMPPLTKVQGYPYGELRRLNAEVSFSIFRGGLEVNQKSGYYVDPYNLIPYFFKVDHLGVSSAQEIVFFGGLKTSKGHSFGASFSQSTGTVKEQLSVASAQQDVEKKSTKVGLSYSYVY